MLNHCCLSIVYKHTDDQSFINTFLNEHQIGVCWRHVFFTDAYFRHWNLNGFSVNIDWRNHSYVENQNQSAALPNLLNSYINSVIITCRSESLIAFIIITYINLFHLKTNCIKCKKIGNKLNSCRKVYKSFVTRLN